jgi:methionyl-tRNA synthetase
MQQYAFSRYLEKIEQAIVLANQYMDSQKPWTLKDVNSKRMQNILFILVKQIYRITKFLFPVIPIASEKVLKQINPSWTMDLNATEDIPEKVTISRVEVLFPKINNEETGNFDVFTNN